MLRKISELESECMSSEQEIATLDADYEEIVTLHRETEEKVAKEHVEEVEAKKLANLKYRNRLWELLYNINN